MSSAAVQSGLDRIASGDSTVVSGKRIALIAHPASIAVAPDGSLVHAIDVLAQTSQATLVRLLGPEHGLRGSAQDMISVGAEVDRKTGLPIVSLYGTTLETLTPTKEALADIDAVVFDLQDIGARYYTYVWTLLLTMRACSGTGIEVIVLDRPNPLGGVGIEGGEIEAGFESFVGLSSLPNRHGLTAAEIAQLTREREGLDVELTVVKMQGWKRSMWFDETGLPWVLPSPNMPTLETAIVYPGMCLIEGTELSEGRGTTRPFEFVGAPFVDGEELAGELAKDLESGELAGVAFRPMSFEPGFQKHRGAICGGVQLHVTDREVFRSYDCAVAILVAIHRCWPSEFDWRVRAYEFVDTIPAIDLLAGSKALREAIDAGAGLAEVKSQWRDAENSFRITRDPFLLYPSNLSSERSS